MALAESQRVRRKPSRQIAREDECHAITGVDIQVDSKMLLPDFQADRECLWEFNAKYRKGPGNEQACKGLVDHIAPVLSIHNPYRCMPHDEYVDLAQNDKSCARASPSSSI